MGVELLFQRPFLCMVKHWVPLIIFDHHYQSYTGEMSWKVWV
jgi:hypothetical protein